MTPLLAPKPFADYSPQEFKAYIESLYVTPPVPKPPADYAARVNDKGTLVLTVRRKPKWLMAEEVGEIALALGWELQKTWLAVAKKKPPIEIKQTPRVK